MMQIKHSIVHDPANDPANDQANGLVNDSINDPMNGGVIPGGGSRGRVREGKRIPQHHEVLSTLGGAVLKVVLVEMFMEFGFHTKWCFTEVKSELESEEGLEQIARDLNLGEHIILGKGEKKQHAHEESRVLAETLEALIGAVFLDSCYQSTRGVIQRLFQEDFDKVCE